MIANVRLGTSATSEMPDAMPDLAQKQTLDVH